MTSYEPVSALLLGGHGKSSTASDGAPQRDLRAVKSHASILRPLASVADQISNLYSLIYPSFPALAAEDDASISRGRVPRSLEHMALQGKLQSAKQYEEWEAAALRLDEFEGHDNWKATEESTDYDVAVLNAKLAEVDGIRKGGDLKRMLMYVRTSLHRDVAGIGNPRLYRQSRIGTKLLVERYIAAVVDLVQSTIELTSQNGYPLPWSVDKMREMWLQTRQAFGRTALLLSGGGTLGMCHVGVVKALYEADALPRIISGTSAGSIVASVCCSRTGDEIPALLQEFCFGELDVFFKKEEESQKYANMAKHFLTQGNLYDINNLNRVMKLYLGDMTFIEAYNRTNRILNICVSNEDPREQLSVLNYVTAPNVLIWSAVAASCSVPLIYSPAKLYEKHPRTGELIESSQSWIDGSMNGDIPMERLSELFDVNHFIVSQVNPHIMPFLSKDDDVVSAEAQDQAPVLKDTLLAMAKDELLFRLKMTAEMGVFPTASIRLRALISQTYQGDINIVPQVSRVYYLRVLSNPTPDFMIEACEAGEKATWPKINRIRSRVAIERAIELAVKEACDFAEFSGSKIALRQNAYGKIMSAVHNTKHLGRPESRSGQSFISAMEPRPKSRSKAHRPTKSLHERVPVHWDESSLHRPDSSHADGELSSDDSSVTSQDAALFSKDEKADTLVSDTDMESDVSQPVPTKWSDLRRFARSQPVTPSIASRTFGVTPPTMTPAVPAMTPRTTTGGVPNTSAKRQSPAEATYKRIFHSAKRQLSPSSSSTPLQGPEHEQKTSSLPRRNSKMRLNLSLKPSGSKSSMAKKTKAGKMIE